HLSVQLADSASLFQNEMRMPLHPGAVVTLGHEVDNVLLIGSPLLTVGRMKGRHALCPFWVAWHYAYYQASGPPTEPAFAGRVRRPPDEKSGSARPAALALSGIRRFGGQSHSRLTEPALSSSAGASWPSACLSANSLSSLAASSAEVPGGNTVNAGLRLRRPPGPGFGMRFTMWSMSPSASPVGFSSAGMVHVLSGRFQGCSWIICGFNESSPSSTPVFIPLMTLRRPTRPQLASRSSPVEHNVAVFIP